MKTNPTCAKAECPKEFPDNLNFCQLCGARLTAVVAEDPFKTVVATGASNKEDPFLYIPEPPAEAPAAPDDSLKTMMASDFAAPELPFSVSEAAPPPNIEEPQTASADSGQISSPVSDPESEPTLISSQVPNFDETFTGMPLPGNSPYSTPTSEPVSSPFEQPSSNPFDSPSYQTPSFMEPESASQNDPFGSPFAPPASPFGQQNQIEQAWTPPPAPDSNWSNQGVGQNTPFQPPLVSGQGQNQTLAIVSLVCGILGLCCGISGIAAIITGVMQRNNIAADPNQYGGGGMALAGIILGGISVLLMIVGILLQVLGALVR